MIKELMELYRFTCTVSLTSVLGPYRVMNEAFQSFIRVTQAFEEAWGAAYKVEGSTMVVPSGSVFLVKPVSFSGPNCKPNIVFQLDGKIIAPSEAFNSEQTHLKFDSSTNIQEFDINVSSPGDSPKHHTCLW